MKHHVLSWAKQILKIAFAGGLLWYLFHSGAIDLESLSVIATPAVIGSGILILGLILFLASERWRLLLKQQGFPVPSNEAFRLTLIGTFFNFFVPGGVGGDLVKGVLIANRQPQQKGKVMLTVLVDRVLGLFTMSFLALVSFAFAIELLERDHAFQIIFIALLGILVAFLVLFFLLLSNSASALRSFVERMVAPIPKLQKIWLAFQTYRLTGRELALLLCFSFGAQLCQILFFMVVARGLDAHPPIEVFLFAVPLGFMVTAIPIAPAGIGIGQAAFLYLFSKALGSQTNLGAVGITAFQTFQLFYGVLGAFFFVLLRKTDPRLSLHELENTQV